MSVTEGFFVRIDCQVARLARATAQERQIPLRDLVERALQLFIAEETAPERRVAAIHAMEEQLLGRMDRRLGQHFERIAGLYAREAFDLAQALDLIKRLLAHTVRKREDFEQHLSESRAEATRTLKRRADWPGKPDPATEEMVTQVKEMARGWYDRVQQLEQDYTELKQEKSNLQKQERKLEGDIRELQYSLSRSERKAEELESRFTWAVRQFESQRGFGKQPISAFLEEWDKHGGKVG